MRRRCFETTSRRLGAVALVVATGVASVGGGAGAQQQPAERLGQTGLFVHGSVTAVRVGNLPFAPQYPLWTDGATKRRWIRLPAGSAVDGSRPDAWEFPPGTRLWKEFSFAGRRVETRFIERGADGTWRYAAYVWNEAGTEATRAPARGLPGGVEVGPGLRHVIPGEADCRACHEGGATPVLGFGALQLSPDRDPGAPHAETVPRDGVDLRTLVARGLVRGLPRRLLEQPPRISAASATARAALGYLHANCGTCHNREGPLAPLGLSLAQELAPPDGAAAVLRSLAAPSRFPIPALPGDTFRVVRGRPDLSALVFRMRTRDPLAQMPPLGTALVDETGVALVERWIRESTNQQEETRP